MKTLVLGIDAANAELLDRWNDQLPVIGELRARGTLHRTIGLEDYFVGSTWPSLYTGLDPGNHGHHALVQLAPDSYAYRRMADGDLVRGRPFWESLSDSGHSVAILDVPLTQLSAELNGIQTVEWGSHDALYGFHAHPSELRESIERTFGQHPLGGSCDALRSSTGDYRLFLEALERGIETKTRITQQLLTQNPWDFAIQVFTEAHCAGHQAWHLHDASHPAYDPQIVSELGDPLLRIYRRIDSAIGEILEAISPDTTIVLLSAHGMSYWYGAQFLLRDVLVALGVTRLPAETPSAARRRRIGQLVDETWMSLPNAVREGLRPIVRRVFPGDPEPARVPSLGVDVGSSACFPVVNGQPVGGIRINLAGREPQGIVAPRDFDELCSGLTRDLLQIIDSRTGEPAVKRVVRSADVHAGRAQQDLPDLLVHWSETVPTGAAGMGPEGSGRVTLTSPKIGSLEGTNEFRRTGEHRPDGFFIVARPGSTSSNESSESTGPRRGEEIRLLDLAPSFAAAYGVALPEADGRVVPGLID